MKQTEIGQRPAFPKTEGAPGMTMRQWYKGMFMSGYIAGEFTVAHSDFPNAVQLAEMAGRYADAMLAEDAVNGA